MKLQLPLFLGLAAIAASPLSAQIGVNLTPNLPSPQPVGTTISWTATATGGTGTYEYQFSAEGVGQPLQVRQDYSPLNTWSWTPSTLDGSFTVTVAVKDTSNDTGSSSVTYKLSSRLNGGLAAVNTTNHPLVALFSAPACQSPNSMRVRFQQVSALTSFTTSLQPCRFSTSTPDTSSMNFLVAGMYASSTYMMHWETVNPTGTVLHTGTNLSFTTGPLPSTVFFPVYTVIMPAPAGDTAYPILLNAFLTIPQAGGTPVPTATDLNGNILWYYPQGVSEFGRTEIGGNMMGNIANPDPTKYYLREWDLAGNTVVETNVTRLNEQLATYNFPPMLENPNGGTSPYPTPTYITGTHHEARRLYTPTGALPDGWVITLGTEEISSTAYQGGTPTAPVDILGDKILVLDQNFQLKWAWSSLDWIPLSRAAILGETCHQNSGGCQPFNPQFSVANDWLHSNSLQYNWWDGHIIISERHQDWVLKVDFANGAGDGHIVWYLGGGIQSTFQPQFTLTTNNTVGQYEMSYPWFSHQHDVEFELGGAQIGGNRILSVFDDGNTRVAGPPFSPYTSGDSRCQMYAINGANFGANLNFNSDIGSYSFALGSAQLLNTGNVHCNSGIIGGLGPGAYAQSTESDATTGNVVFNLKAAAGSYRSFRLKDLYTPDTP